MIRISAATHLRPPNLIPKYSLGIVSIQCPYMIISEFHIHDNTEEISSEKILRKNKGVYPHLLYASC